MHALTNTCRSAWTTRQLNSKLHGLVWLNEHLGRLTHERRSSTSQPCADEPSTPESWPVSLALTAMWGANTNVGKTLASIGLAHAAANMQVPLLYVKPVQTGFPRDSDAQVVATACSTPLDLGDHAAFLHPSQAKPSSSKLPSTLRRCKVIHAWSAPVSPHLAVKNEGRFVSDSELLSSVVSEVQSFTRQLGAASPASSSGQGVQKGLGLIETAGGVASPAPSGRIMCDVLRPLRLPCILVGDPRLGGISSTVSAYESLLLRGYDVNLILMLDPADTCSGVPLPHLQRRASPSSSKPGGLGNADALRAALATAVHRLGGQPLEIVSIPGCPPPSEAELKVVQESGGKVLDPTLASWLQDTKPYWAEVLHMLMQQHEKRISALNASVEQARQRLWWPFTQHGSLRNEAVEVFDSRFGEQVVSYKRLPTHAAAAGGSAVPQPSLVPMFDACASWWTQTVNPELQPELARSVAYAAGRYLHVMSPQVVHELGLRAATQLLAVAGGSWASRVFFSDDGSTAIEVALKMAFRTFIQDMSVKQGRDLLQGPLELKVVGLQNAYHGDTLGAMDCVAPSVFNAAHQAPWYRGRGVFLAPPYVAMSQGRWSLVDVPDWLSQDESAASLAQSEKWSDLVAVTSASRDNSQLSRFYRQYISKQLDAHDAAHTGPVPSYLAALIIEPLVQGAGGMLMVDPQFQRELVQVCRSRGMPVIFDEVMAGLYRLGSATAAQQLRMQPDIACYAKLMTAGVVPMAATLTSEHVFNSFRGDSKLQALLHGHSYTAYPVGCASTVAALDILTSSAHNKNLCHPSQPNPTCPTPEACKQACGKLTPMWDASRVSRLSHHGLVQHIIAAGTVCAVKLRSASSGYGSTSSMEVVTRLRDEHHVYARPLGDVVYLMVTPTTEQPMCDRLLDSLRLVLDECQQAGAEGLGKAAYGDGCVV